MRQVEKRMLSFVIYALIGLTMVSYADVSLAQEDRNQVQDAPVHSAPSHSFPSFQAKRIKPPEPGRKKLITIQIDPEQASEPTPSDITREQTTPVVQTRYPWFWEMFSPSLAEASPGRLEDALHEVTRRADIDAPRLQVFQDIVKAHGIDILKATIGANVSPALVLAVISVESSGHVDAVSTAGALGLMQLMPDTAARFGVTDPFVPEQNIAGGVALLDVLIRQYEADPILVLAAYNAGAGSVRDHDGVPPFPETRNYVPKVLAAYQVAQGLCQTPPILISDGCVFQSLK